MCRCSPCWTGVVLSVQTGINDFSHGTLTGPFDNHLVLEHADGRHTVYGHLADKSIKLERGDRVRAGQQIALTASSGSSTWPHLHFTVRRDGVPVEPFAGQCREGESLLREQPELSADLYVRDFAFSPKAFQGRAELPWDEAVRTGTFVRGVRMVHLRLVAGNTGGGRTARVRIRPARRLGSARPLRRAEVQRRPLGLDERVVSRRPRPARALDLEYEVDGRPSSRRRSTSSRLRSACATGRRGRWLSSSFPAAPRTDEVVFCRVSTSLVAEDPDYDVVRYRYRWTAGDRVVRDVTSAALSDAIPRATARPGRVDRLRRRPLGRPSSRARRQR